MTGLWIGNLDAHMKLKMSMIGLSSEYYKLNGDWGYFPINSLTSSEAENVKQLYRQWELGVNDQYASPTRDTGNNERITKKRITFRFSYFS